MRQSPDRGRWDDHKRTPEDDLTDSTQLNMSEQRKQRLQQQYYHPTAGRYPRDGNEINISLDTASQDPHDLAPDTLSMSVCDTPQVRNKDYGGVLHHQQQFSDAKHADSDFYYKQSKRENAMDEDYYPDDFHEEDNRSQGRPSRYGRK